MKLIDLNNITDSFTKNDVYLIVKTRLGIIGKGVPEELKEAVDEAALMICNYCCRRKVPLALMYVMAELSIDIMTNYNNRKTDTSSESFMDGSTIKVGRVEVVKNGTAISASSESSFQYIISMKDLLDQYKVQLDSFRCLWWC